MKAKAERPNRTLRQQRMANQRQALHTPGPWYQGGDNENGHGILGREGGYHVCLLPDPDEPEQQANAALISAAPEMLSALKELLAESLDWQEALGKGDRPSLDDALKAAQAAVRKAVSLG